MPCVDALERRLDLLDPFADPPGDLIGQCRIALGQQCRRRTVAQHHLAAVRHHLADRAVVVQPPAFHLCGDNLLKPFHVAFRQRVDHIAAQTLIGVSAVFLRKVRQLVGKGIDDQRLADLLPGIDIEIDHPPALIGALHAAVS